jgi:hypothetical protein
MMRKLLVFTAAILLSIAATCYSASPGLWAQWILDSHHVSGNTLTSIQGLPGFTDGTAVWVDGPGGRWYRMDGLSNHFVMYSGASGGLDLPSTAISIEAWGMVQESRDWSSFVNFIQDNGSHERGWILGTRGGAFMFGIASVRDGKNEPYLTYMTADRPYEHGKWYHVAGVYDGKTMKLYVDGRLAAECDYQYGAIAYPAEGTLAVGAYVDSNEQCNLAGAGRIGLWADRAVSRFS